MAYEKALSLISGGGKTFEEVNEFIKATPEEMEVGAIIVITIENTKYASFVAFKSAGAIQTIGLNGNKVATSNYSYIEESGGYVKSLG